MAAIAQRLLTAADPVCVRSAGKDEVRRAGLRLPVCHTGESRTEELGHRLQAVLSGVHCPPELQRKVLDRTVLSAAKSILQASTRAGTLRSGTFW